MFLIEGMWPNIRDSQHITTTDYTAPWYYDVSADIAPVLFNPTEGTMEEGGNFTLQIRVGFVDVVQLELYHT